jgi:hypothetical protein
LKKQVQTEKTSFEFSEICDVYCTEDYCRMVEKVVAQEQPDVVMAFYGIFSKCLETLPKNVLKVIDTIEVFSMPRTDVRGKNAEMYIQATAEEERLALLRADIIVAIQENEAKYLRLLVPERRVLTVGVDFTAASELSMPAHGSPAIGIMGSSNPYNQEGLLNFLEHCWPLVLDSLPDARLVLAGRLCEIVQEEQRNVHLLGWVRDEIDFYKQIHLVVNPAIRGTGLKIKCVEALAHGRPVASLPVGVEGLEDAIGGPILCSNSWKELARDIVYVLGDPDNALRLSQQAYEYARNHFSIQKVYGELTNALEDPALMSAQKSHEADVDG